MENRKLYLCTKTAEGDLYPFYEINGSFFSTNRDQSGGSIYNLDMFIPNINPAKFEEKTRKLKNEEDVLNRVDDDFNESCNSIPMDNVNESKTDVDANAEEECVIGGAKNKLKNGSTNDNNWPTMDLEDSIQKYLQKNKY